ncbi:hypothetical protein BYT27DRAFT_7263262 [Phlegmacium glaucopus]|nr:hypothetical protein BYT27DRAFT_7263262 [Phlegmacium glaucopus]
MANPTNRRPILKKNVEAFVPSPRFLSESPARQPSSGKSTPAHISRPGQPLSPAPAPSSSQLLSPVPPPPANLFAGNAAAFNVDPGIPFLATVGPSDAGNSDKGSINQNESPKRFVGGFVTGLKKALTTKGSRRQSSKYQQAGEEIHSLPTMIRDSGYAASSRLEEPPANQPPLTTFPPSAPPSYPPATSEQPFHYNAPPVAPYDDIQSLDSIDISAIKARVGYGPDYAKMDRPTPPQSDISFNTYMTRFQNFVHDLAALPWISNERVTVDYYPAASERRGKRLSHRPAIVWRSQDYHRSDYHLDSDSESSSVLKMTPHLHVRAPSRISQIDLDAEFSDKTTTPLPYHPPNTAQLTDTLPPSPQKTGMPEMSQAYVDNPRSGFRVDGNPTLSKTPPARKTPTLAPPSSTPPLMKTPSARKPSLAQRGGPEPLPSLPPNTGRTRDQSHPMTPKDAKPAFSGPAPIRHRPASVRPSSNVKGDPPRMTPTSDQRWGNTPKPEPVLYSWTPTPIPETPSSNRLPKSGRQPTPGSSSRRSRRSHTPSRRSRQESTGEWESFPQDRPGYVPFEYSENYYGTRYGVGIHGLLPPVAPVSSVASTAPSIKQPSIKQPQPQYPKSTLVTPPSRSSSLS